VPCDLGSVKSIERLAVALALSQNRLPAQARLRTLQDEEFKEEAVVMHGHAPLFVMVARQNAVLRPMASAPGRLQRPGARSIRHGELRRYAAERLSRFGREGLRRQPVRPLARP